MKKSKKEIFRKILNLERYVKFYKKADEILKSLKDDLNSLNTKVEVNKEMRNSTLVQLEILKKAKEMNLIVLSPDEFFRLINHYPPGPH